MTLSGVERVDPNALEPLEVKRFHRVVQGRMFWAGDRSLWVFPVATSVSEWNFEHPLAHSTS
jgi:hypothetical protein